VASDSSTPSGDAPEVCGELATRAGYDAWAQVYDGDANPLVALEERELPPLLGAVRGQRVLDVGCGTGRHALRLAAQGARVTAIDFSEGMLQRARSKPGAEAVTFLQHDLSQRLPFADRAHDLVLCGLVVDHIAGLRELFGEMGRVCNPDGRLVVTVMHPAMMLKGVQARFTDPQSGKKLQITSCSHQVSDYVMAALGAGLRIDHLGEHAPDSAFAAAVPRAERYVGWPLLLLMLLRPSA